MMMAITEMKGGHFGRPSFRKLLGSRAAASDVVYVSKKQLREAEIEMLALLRLNGILQRNDPILSCFASRRMLLEIRDFGQ